MRARDLISLTRPLIMDAPMLLLALHSRLLRRLCSRSQGHFAGLAVAGRALQLPGPLQKKLARVDVACAYVRHVTEVMAEDLFCQVDAVLDDLPCGAQPPLVPGIGHDGEPIAVPGNAAGPWHVG